MSSSGSHAGFVSCKNTLHCASASSTMQITAKAPQCESFRIRCRVARSRRESTASQTSM